MKKWIHFFAITLFLAPNVWAQVSITATNGVVYTTNFDNLASPTGSGNCFNTATWTDNSTLANWYAGVLNNPASTTAVLKYGVCDGSGNSGSVYNYGTVGLADRALGSLGSGSTGNQFYGVRMVNNTSQAIATMKITYTGEQWRDGGGSTNSTDSLIVAFQTGTTVISPTTGSWTNVNGLLFIAPSFGTVAATMDGNVTANRRTLSSDFTVNLQPGQEIMFRWRDNNAAGSDEGLAIDDLTIEVTSVATASDRDELPEDYTLSSAYPNPFNPSTSFELTLAAAQQVRVSVYNALGQEVRNLHNGNLSAGTTQFNFNAAGLPSGLYFYRVQGANFAQTKSVTLLK
ncbi:MAG: T9SS type A sorting domain-containing protein [Rhodothermia bacterium]|nr:T9SS type A sorting domain-containing protein [Rhodothermia bacterium]